MLIVNRKFLTFISTFARMFRVADQQHYYCSFNSAQTVPIYFLPYKAGASRLPIYCPPQLFISINSSYLFSTAGGLLGDEPALLPFLLFAMKTLKLFNAVTFKSSDEKPYISEHGFIIESGALWAKDRILKFYEEERLSGNDLNKTFHKSWQKIKDSSRFELLLDQIAHYVSTYGSDFSDDIYIPDEVLELPEVKLSYKVIKAYTKEEMLEKCFYMLQSGIALQEETIDDLLSVMVEDLGYTFTGDEKIKNKEAVVKIADMYGVLPNDTMEFFRYIVYRATGSALLIKNRDSVEAIKKSSFNPAAQFNKFGVEKLAEIFNRFKPLFLAFKPKCSKTINAISRASKKYHKPLVQNPLNNVTNEPLTSADVHWLDNATPFALFKAVSSCYNRMQGQNAFVYRVRNGKSYVKEDTTSSVNKKNYNFLMKYLKSRFDMSEIKLYIPEDIEYALPTSEKMYIGNIPTGTKFYGEKLAVGVYWEDSWGAHDLDLSGLNIGGKVGWNSDYSQRGNLMYSGDITSAPNGAVEYLYANEGLSDPTLVQNNVYSGEPDCGYKIIVGRGDGITRNYMMNPENLFAEVKCQSVQHQTILGMVLPQKDRQCFVLLNFGAGHARVSGYSKFSEIATKALYQQWSNPMQFNDMVAELGATLLDKEEFEMMEPEEKEGVVDLSIDKLEKDSFMRLFKA